MTTGQKIIKYFGYGLAALIIVNIIYILFYGVGNIFGTFTQTSEPTSSSFKKTLTKSSNSIQRIEIEISRVNLIIEEGNNFNIETSNKYITSSVKDNTLYISEKSHKLWETDKGDIILTIPEDKQFSFFSIEAGTASINIEKINTETLILKLGAGKTKIKSLNTTKRTTINGGAGTIEINESIIHNLNLDIGVGSVNLTTELIGENDINCGIGSLNLSLNKSIEDYNFKIDKGIGSIKINDENYKNVTLPNQGENSIDIDGGIGSINIYTIDKY